MSELHVDVNSRAASNAHKSSCAYQKHEFSMRRHASWHANDEYFNRLPD